jgi:hypothetical protein
MVGRGNVGDAGEIERKRPFLSCYQNTTVLKLQAEQEKGNQ